MSELSQRLRDRAKPRPCCSNVHNPESRTYNADHHCQRCQGTGMVEPDGAADLLAAAEALEETEKETKRLEWLIAHGLAYVWRGNPRYSVELTFRNRDELDKAIKKEVSNGTTK